MKQIVNQNLVMTILNTILIENKNQLQAVFPQQGRQGEPSIKTLRSPYLTVFWRHCMLSGRIQR